MGYIIFALVLCVSDIVIKNRIAAKEISEFPKAIFKGHMNITRTHNYGMAGNRMEDEPEKVKKMTTMAVAVVFLMSLPFLFSKKTSFVRKMGFAFLLGGSFSNLADRYIRGYVVDYLRPVYGDGRECRYTFNIADVCIFIGAVFTILGKMKRNIK